MACGEELKEGLVFKSGIALLLASVSLASAQEISDEDLYEAIRLCHNEHRAAMVRGQPMVKETQEKCRLVREANQRRHEEKNKGPSKLDEVVGKLKK